MKTITVRSKSIEIESSDVIIFSNGETDFRIRFNNEDGITINKATLRSGETINIQPSASNEIRVS